VAREIRPKEPARCVGSAGASGTSAAATELQDRESDRPRSQPFPGSRLSTARRGVESSRSLQEAPARRRETRIETASGFADDHPLLGRFRRRIEPVAVTGGYRIALALVAAAMVVLPLLYLALIALAGWATALWAYHGFFLIAGRGGLWLRLLLYGGPLAVGVIVVAFLVKPLFAPRPKAAEPLRLERGREPLLFAFVDRLCEVVGSPRPREIRVDCAVNASAALRRGLLSLGRDDLVLTIGLPLAEGLTVEQLAGILGHEFGHFAQRSGMALSFVIRSVNHWFERVVHQRDAWDEALVEQSRSGDFRLRVVAAVARGGVWLARRVLWVLMVAGHALSCLLMRHMEFDADRYDARLVGSRVFAATVGEMFGLAAGEQQALAQLEEAWREGRLGDSLPALVVAHRRALAAPIEAAFKEHLANARTGRFHTHPADPERIASALREGREGVFACDLPAGALLGDLEALARAATRHHYRVLLGSAVDRASLVPSAELVAQGEALRQEHQAAERVFGTPPAPSEPVPTPLRPLPPETLAAGPEAATAAESIRELAAVTAAAASAAAGLRAIFPRLSEQRAAVNSALQAEALLAAGRRIDPARFGLTDGSAAGAAAARRAAETGLAAHLPAIDAFNELAARRVMLALRLRARAAGTRGSTPAEPVAGVVEDGALLAAATAIGAAAADVRALLGSLVVLSGLWSQVEGETRDPRLVNAIREESARGLRAIEAIRSRLLGVAYPFPFARDGLDLASYVVPDVPTATEYVAIYRTGEETMQRLYAVYGRILGVFATWVEMAEAPVPRLADAPAANAGVAEVDQPRR
jgi:Zn-dependent protease with chaperone function